MESGAQARMNSILSKMDNIESVAQSRSDIGSSAQNIASERDTAHNYYTNPAQDPKNFKAMASLMQAQMLGEGLNSNDKNSSGGIFGGGMGMMNQMAMMTGNPALLNMAGGINPMGGMMPGMMQNQMPMQTFQAPVFPIKGADKTNVSSEFGHRIHPIHGHEHFHTGVDIAAAEGTAIRMPWEARVVYVGKVQGFGDNTVIVAHDKNVQPNGEILYSIFGHNRDVFVQQGEMIRQGDIFATVGSEGNSTGPHLHWETRAASPYIGALDIFKDQVSTLIDPMSLIA